MTAETAYYKVVGPNGEPLNGGRGDWPLPHDGQPGAWREVDGDIVPCRNGLHLATRAQLPTWVPSVNGYDRTAFVVYRAEVDGPVIDAGGKVVARRVRLLPRSADHPAPDVLMLAARRQRAKARADRAYVAAYRAAPAIPAPWVAYLAALGPARLPAGHPGAPYAAMMSAWRTATNAADEARRSAYARADRVYDAAILASILPD